MGKTLIENVIVPEVFNPYVVERTAQKSALFQSGIIATNPELDRLASSGGRLINMPYWEDLTGDDEVLNDDGALTPGKIEAKTDVACLLMRGKAWSVNDLAKALSGDDPMGVIADLVADYWARRWQDVLISQLSGVFGASSMSGNLLDISGDTTPANTLIDADTIMDALQKLGDADNLLTAVVMHSVTRTRLRKLDLIDFIPDSQTGIELPYYMGKRVIVDDRCPVSSGVYTTYFFGNGAFGLGEGGAPVPTEMDRDSLAGDDILINRRHFILHPRGVKWTDASVAGSSPTNAELATSANWSRAYENKNIRIVAFKHKNA